MTARASTKRADNRARKLETIRETALRLVEEGGVPALTINQVARELGIAVAGLYRYYPAKSALVGSLQQHVIGTFADAQTRVLDTLATRGADSLALIYAVGKHYQRHFLARPGHFGLISSALAYPRPIVDDAVGHQTLEYIQPSLMCFFTLLETAASTGALSRVGGRGSVDRVFVFWGMVQGMVQMAKLMRFAPEAMENNRLLRQAITDLLVGWGAARDKANEAAETAEKMMGEIQC